MLEPQDDARCREQRGHRQPGGLRASSWFYRMFQPLGHDERDRSVDLDPGETPSYRTIAHGGGAKDRRLTSLAARQRHAETRRPRQYSPTYATDAVRDR